MALDVLAFYMGLDEKSAGYTYLERYGNLLTYLAVFQVGIQNNGQLSGRVSQGLVQGAHDMGVQVLPVISNMGSQGQFSVPLLQRLIYDPSFANTVWHNVRTYLLGLQCDGVNFDLERAAPGDRPAFTRLIADWGQKFRKDNLTVSLNVPAKTADDPNKAWTGFFDYSAIGQNVDFVVLMTYEEHWPGSSPGSIASLPWVTQVVNYALDNMPASKVFLGLGFYGYDWSQHGGARALSYPRALEIARQFGAPLYWNAQQHSTYFTYELAGDRHTVYFEDPRSIAEKLDLAQAKGLRGVAVWNMNLSYDEFWDVLRTYVQAP